MEWRRRLQRVVRPQDFVWILLFAVLATYGPDLSVTTNWVFAGLAIMQVVEPKIPFFGTTFGGAVSFGVKLTLWYILMGWTDGVASGYYWILLVPVVSAATSFGIIGTVIATLLACGAYLSLLYWLRPDQYLPPDQQREFILRMCIFPLVGYLTHELAEANRLAARKYQAAGEQLAEANVHLMEAEAAVRRSERLAALGQMSAGLAHELRNPLGTMKTSAELLARTVSGENAVAQEMAGFISSEVDRTNSLVTRFLDFARPLAVRLEQTDLAQVIDQAISEVEKYSPPFDVVIYKNYSPDIPPFLLDPELMKSVMYNLLLNAAQASPPRGSITVKTRRTDDNVEIAVIDCGPGIDPSQIENIFNPFFTTKPKGVGLGLAIVSKIVDEHRGSITVESEPGAGSVFRICLPFREGK